MKVFFIILCFTLKFVVLFSITWCKYMKHLRNSQEIVEKFSCINIKFSMLVLNNHFNFVIMKVIENIKRIRLEKGIPQKLLADALSVDDSVK